EVSRDDGSHGVDLALSDRPGAAAFPDVLLIDEGKDLKSPSRQLRGGGRVIGVVAGENHHGLPGRRIGWGIRPGRARRRQNLEGVVMAVASDAYLLEVIDALRSRRCCTYFLNGWHQQGDEDRDDG